MLLEMLLVSLSNAHIVLSKSASKISTPYWILRAGQNSPTSPSTTTSTNMETDSVSATLPTVEDSTIQEKSILSAKSVLNHTVLSAR